MNDFAEKELKALEEMGCQFAITNDVICSELDFYEDDKYKKYKIHIINDSKKRHEKLEEHITRKRGDDASSVGIGVLRDIVRREIINKGKPTDYTFSFNYDSEVMEAEVGKLAMLIRSGFKINRFLER